MSGGLDWPGLMAAGLGQLRLAPDAFWSMSPAEFRSALAGAGLAAPAGLVMGRSRLAALMRAHPDRATDDRGDRHDA